MTPAAFTPMPDPEEARVVAARLTKAQRDKLLSATWRSNLMVVECLGADLPASLAHMLTLRGIASPRSVSPSATTSPKRAPTMSGDALLPLATWVPILDGDPIAAAMYEQHYSSARSRDRRRARGTLLIMGPGYKLLLTTPCRRAIFAWRKQRFADGVECSVFRNTGAGLSSDLIRAADAIADRRWPGERHYTYVDPAAVANSNAGRCFVRAGWTYVRSGKRKTSPRARTSRGLLTLERAPSQESPNAE